MIGAASATPIPDGDAVFFLPCAVDLATGKGLTHPFYAVIPDNPARLCVWHGWFFPYLTALLPWSRSYATVGISLQLTGLACLGLAVWALLRVGRGTPQLAAVSCLPMTLLIQAQIGRPEPIVTGCAAGIALVVASGWPSLAKQIAWGALLGIIAVTSPAAGVAYAIVSVMLCVMMARSFAAAAIGAGLIATASLAVLLIATVALAPTPLTTWLWGIATNVRVQYVERTSAASLIEYYVTSAHFPGLVVYLACLAAAAVAIVSGVSGWRRWGLLVLLLALFAFVYRMALRLPETSYNFLALTPVVVAVSLVLARSRGIMGPCLTGALVLQASVAAAGLAYQDASTLAALRGLGAQAFEQRIRAALSSRPGVVAADPPLAVVISNALGPTRVQARLGTSIGARVDYLALHQANSAFAQPPSVPGFKLLTNGFGPAPRLLGVKIGHTPKDWSYAIYCRASACPAGIE